MGGSHHRMAIVPDAVMQRLRSTAAARETVDVEALADLAASFAFCSCGLSSYGREHEEGCPKRKAKVGMLEALAPASATPQEKP